MKTALLGGMALFGMLALALLGYVCVQFFLWLKNPALRNRQSDSDGDDNLDLPFGGDSCTSSSEDVCDSGNDD